MRTATRLLACLLLACAAHAQDSDGGVPLDPTQGQGAPEADIAQSEAGEDAAPEGIVSRASGRPDHPRTLEEIVKSGYIRVLTRNNDTSFSSIAGTGWASTTRSAEAGAVARDPGRHDHHAELGGNGAGAAQGRRAT